MPFRDDLDALEARHAALDAEVGAKTRERDDAKHLLDDARARAKLPVLDNLRIASPCRADWSKMAGDDRVRACAECNQNVYDLSGLTRDEAESLLVAKNGRLCVRYYQRADGTILLADCVVGKRRRRRRVVIATGLAGVIAGASVAYGTGSMRYTHHAQLVDDPFEQGYIAGGARSYAPPPDVTVKMGDVSPTTDPPPRHTVKMGKPHLLK